jgi:hypothetical protein
MDVNFVFYEWLTFLSNNESINEAGKLVGSGGVLSGKPKHTQATHQGKLKLGELEDVDITHAGYMAPETYDEFVDDLTLARERGNAWAWCRWETAFSLLAIQQFEDKEMWTQRELVPRVDEHLTCRRVRTKAEFDHLTPEESINIARDLRVRETVTIPDGMRYASGCAEFTHLPAKRIDPEVLTVPPRFTQVMKEIDAKVREELMKDNAQASKLGGLLRLSFIK